MTDPYPPKIAVKPPAVRPRVVSKVREPLHLHKRAYHSLSGDSANVPAVEKVPEKD